MDEENVLDFLTSLEAMDLPDRIEEVNARILDKIVEETDFVAVLFCKCILITYCLHMNTKQRTYCEFFAINQSYSKNKFADLQLPEHSGGCRCQEKSITICLILAHSNSDIKFVLDITFVPYSA